MIILDGDGGGGRRTNNLGIKKLYEHAVMEKWYNPTAYKVVLKMLLEELDEVELLRSQKGLAPGK